MRFVSMDIEITDPLPSEEYHWRESLGVSCCGTATPDEPKTWATPADAGSYLTYRPRMDTDTLRVMCRYLQGQELSRHTIVTWNGLGFDFRMLAQDALDNGDRDLAQDWARMALGHCDLAFQMRAERGYMIGLDTAAEALDAARKTEGMHGDMVPELWQGGPEQQAKCMAYVQQDAIATLDVAKSLWAKCSIRWITKRGNKARFPWYPTFMVEHAPAFSKEKVAALNEQPKEYLAALGNSKRRFLTVREVIRFVPCPNTRWMTVPPKPLHLSYDWAYELLGEEPEEHESLLNYRKRGPDPKPEPIPGFDDPPPGFVEEEDLPPPIEKDTDSGAIDVPDWAKEDDLPF